MALTLARLLTPHGFNFIFYDINPNALTTAKSMGYRVYEDIGRLIQETDAIMIAVSHSKYQEAIQTVKEELLNKPDRRVKLVFDIASFKEDLIKEYKGYPDDVMVASVHPLFGPGARNPSSHTVAVIPIPGRDGSEILSGIFRRAGFNVVVVDAEAHDELVNYTIGASYIIASALARIIGNDWDRINEMAGTTFRLLRILVGSVANDHEDFISHILSRPGTRRVAEQLMKAITESVLDPQSSAENIKLLVGGEALRYYEDLYDCLEK